MIKTIRSMLAPAAVLLMLLFPRFLPASEKDRNIELIYFFSSSCPHCLQAAPVVKELSRKYHTRGYYPRKEQQPDYPFPVEKGNPQMLQDYGIQGFPSLVVLINGMARQKIVGAVDIPAAPELLKAFANGALSVSEALESPAGFPLTVAAFVRAAQSPEGKRVYALSDGEKVLVVAPWRREQGARTMAGLNNKAVAVRGRIMTNGSGKSAFVVEREVNGD